MSDINNIIAERASNYGSFVSQAAIVQRIKQQMAHSRNWKSLDYDMKESLEMIALKISRILNGSSDHIDSWKDIVGYAELIVKRLETELMEWEASNDETTT